MRENVCTAQHGRGLSLCVKSLPSAQQGKQHSVNVRDQAAWDSYLTRSFDEPSSKLDSLFSNKSSAFKWPAAPGSGGKLDSPNSKLGDGGFGGVGD